jgi:nicotinamidase/pyrazinamidase
VNHWGTGASARPKEVAVTQYDPSTALIVVDVQNDFAHPAGSLHVHGAEAVIRAADREIALAREAGSPVIYTQDWHPASTPHFAKDGGAWPVHCVADTWGAAFHDDLDVHGEVVRKGTGGEDGYSGFSVRDPTTGETSSTGLAALLRERDIHRVVVIGLATDYCVVETAMDAVRESFSTVAIADAMAAVNLQPGDGERAIARMRDAGVAVE